MILAGGSADVPFKERVLRIAQLRGRPSTTPGKACTGWLLQCRRPAAACVGDDQRRRRQDAHHGDRNATPDALAGTTYVIAHAFAVTSAF